MTKDLHLFIFLLIFILGTKNIFFFFFFSPIGIVVNVTAGESNYELEVPDSSISEELKIKCSDFPSDFIFGAGTSAAQVKHT